MVARLYSIKEIFALRVLKPNVNSLKYFTCKLKKAQCAIFMGKFWKSLNFLEVDVQMDSLTTSPQFYNRPFRCFTFRGFELATTQDRFE